MVNNSQREQIEDLALRNPQVQKAGMVLNNTNVCNEAATNKAMANFEKSMDTAVMEAAKKLDIKLSAKEGHQIGHGLIDTITEDRGAGYCR